jgi:hypothetical protein
LLAEALLTDVDNFLLRLGVPFTRFVDDCRIFCRTKREAVKVHHDLVEYLYTPLFLIGLAALDRDAVRGVLRKDIVVGKAVDIEYALLIVSLLRADSRLADNLNHEVRERIITLLKSLIEADQMLGKVSRLGHPLEWLKVFVRENGQPQVWSEYKPVVEALISKYFYDSDLMSIVALAGPIHDAYFKLLEARLCSTQFHEADPAAKAIPTLDQMLEAVCLRSAPFA